MKRWEADGVCWVFIVCVKTCHRQFESWLRNLPTSESKHPLGFSWKVLEGSWGLETTLPPPAQKWGNNQCSPEGKKIKVKRWPVDIKIKVSPHNGESKDATVNRTFLAPWPMLVKNFLQNVYFTIFCCDVVLVWFWDRISLSGVDPELTLQPKLHANTQKSWLSSQSAGITAVSRLFGLFNVLICKGKQPSKHSCHEDSELRNSWKS